MWPSRDILWRPRPEVSMSIPLPGNQIRKVVVRDSWIRFHLKMPPAHMVGMWMEETCHFRRRFVSSSGRDEEVIVKCCKSDSLLSKKLARDLAVKANIYPNGIAKAVSTDYSVKTCAETDQPLEEPWLHQSFLLSHCIENSNAPSGFTDEEKITKYGKTDFFGSNSLIQYALEDQANCKSEDTLGSVIEEPDPCRTFSERYQLVEEPWLFQSPFLVDESDAKLDSDVPENNESIENEAAHPEIHDLHHEAAENLLTGEKNNVISHDDSVSIVILINSSICTMQRIAVLEDEKLVELLLEPVKTNVQCDSVYVGVVSKLVPHMGGAFVNIGSSRPSLMDIKNNREPFIFPPFGHRSKGKDVNGFLSGMHKEHTGAHGDDPNTHGDEVPDVIEEDEDENDAVEYMYDELQEDETDDDIDVLEVVNPNFNDSVTSSGGSETDNNHDFSELDRSDRSQEAGTFNELLSDDTGCFHSSEPSHPEDIKDNEEMRMKGNKWAQVRKGTKIIVQVVKEGLGSKGPTLTAYPKLRSRFWVLSTRCNSIGISKKISGVERTRLRVIAKTLQPPGFGLTVRTVAAGHSLDELQKDLEGLLSTWKDISEHAKSAALAADEGVEGAVPIMLHRAMGQTLSIVQDYFSEKVESMIVDSPRTYHEVTNYLQDIAPDLCDRVELYSKRTLFDDYNIEEEIDNILSKRVPLANGGYLVIEQTEALVSIDVNGGQCMLGQGTSQEKAILEVNLAAAKQIAREIRLRDIGGIIVVDFIDMMDDVNKRLVYEEVKKSVERDRSTVKVSELSRHGLMEITRKRVRPSVTFMISEPCICCHATGRVEALQTSFSKIEHEICRLLATRKVKSDPEDPKSWPRFILRVDRFMCNYLTSGKRTKLAVLSSLLKVWILLKVARGFTRGGFEVKLTDDKDYIKQQQKQVAISVFRPTTKVSTSYTPRGKVTLLPKKWKTSGGK